MKELVEDLIKIYKHPKVKHETKEIIKTLLEKQADKQIELLDLIHDAIDEINENLPI